MFQGMLVLGLVVFFSASFWVFSGSTNGFYDHFLEVIALLLIWLISRGRHIYVPFLCIIGLSIHEIFALYGLPVIFFATMLKLVEQTPNLSVGKRLRRTATIAGLCFVPVVVWGMVIHSTYPVTGDKLERLQQRIASYIPDQRTQKGHVFKSTFHLKNDLGDNYVKRGGHKTRQTCLYQR